MEELIDAKFRQNPDLARQLLATGDAKIVEVTDGTIEFGALRMASARITWAGP